MPTKQELECLGSRVDYYGAEKPSFLYTNGSGSPITAEDKIRALIEECPAAMTIDVVTEEFAQRIALVLSNKTEISFNELVGALHGIFIDMFERLEFVHYEDLNTQDTVDSLTSAGIPDIVSITDHAKQLKTGTSMIVVDQQRGVDFYRLAQAAINAGNLGENLGKIQLPTTIGIKINEGSTQEVSVELMLQRCIHQLAEYLKSKKIGISSEKIQGEVSVFSHDYIVRTIGALIQESNIGEEKGLADTIRILDFENCLLLDISLEDIRREMKEAINDLVLSGRLSRMKDYYAEKILGTYVNDLKSKACKWLLFSGQARYVPTTHGDNLIGVRAGGIIPSAFEKKIDQIKKEVLDTLT